MITHLYSICRDEEDMLPFLFRHYDSWVDRYVFYDDGSTDGTLDILNAHPKVEVRVFDRSHHGSLDLSKQTIFDSVWKECRGQADWVILIDVDEHLHVPNKSMQEYLQCCTDQGVTIVPALGYQMVSDEFPQANELLSETRTNGAPFKWMSKTCLFNPDAVDEFNSSTGNHWCWPIGRLKLPARDELILSHYKMMGLDYSYKRSQYMKMRMGAQDIANGWGEHYLLTPDQLRNEWEGYNNRAVDLSHPELKQWVNHPSSRWWRPGWKFFLRQIIGRITFMIFGKIPNRGLKKEKNES
jgi:glycosyltransferase involved in cell wall biosynthesis